MVFSSESMENLKIVSLNTRGLGNTNKRKKIYRYLRKHEPDLCFLQETHCTTDRNTQNLWSQEWGNKCLFANGTQEARGVAMLFNKKCSQQVKEVHRDINGRYLICKLEILDETYCVANVYAPNENKVNFFTEIFSIIRNMNTTHIIIGGDLNVVQNVQVDRSMPKEYNKLNKEEIVKGMDEFDLCDIWRIKNPDRKCFTWMKGKDKLSWSRIDYFLISETLSNVCTDAEIFPSVQTDHSLITINISVSSNRRGRGTWKFNNSLLNDEEFCINMVDTLQHIKQTYEYLSKTEKWELLKFEAARTSQIYAMEKAGKRKMDKFKKYRQLGRLQQELLKDNQHEEVKENIEKITTEIRAYETIDAKRAAYRCRLEYQQKGEMSSKYFFGLEKRKYVSKTMYTARRKDGTLTKDYREILNIQLDFYENLFTSNTNTSFDIKNDSGVCIDETNRLAFEDMISKGELFDALMTLRTGRTPGCDGLTLEFYRKFWKIMVDPMHEMYGEAVQEGRLNPSGRRGIINLLPKGKK